MIVWDNIYKFKIKWNLGFRRFVDVNKVFLCKLGWKIIYDIDNFWIQIIYVKYLKDKYF